MAAGFQVFAADGQTLQVDGEYINFSLRKSGTISSSMIKANGLGGYHCCIDITGFNNPTVAYIASGSGNRCSMEVIRPEGTYLGGYVGGRSYVRFTFDDSSASVTYYIFDQWTAPRGNSGVEVFNDSGQVVFHSDWYTMQVRGVINVPANRPRIVNLSSGGDPETFTVGSIVAGTAIMPTFCRLYTVAPNQDIPVTYKSGFWTSGNTLYTRYIASGEYGNSQGWNYNDDWAMPILMVDISVCPVPYG